jgi:hypothetical protein
MTQAAVDAVRSESDRVLTMPPATRSWSDTVTLTGDETYDAAVLDAINLI